jgi:hypothetical protein
VARGGLPGGALAPGLAGAWDGARPVRERRDAARFSSWSNGEQALRLDGSGRTTYTLPLAWWQDQARRALAGFTVDPLHYRVLAFPDPAGTVTDSAAGRRPVRILNNLVSLVVDQLRYHPDGAMPDVWRRHARIRFTVRERGTTAMYNMVQWKRGGRTYEDGSFDYPVRDYGRRHESNYPSWQIDWVNVNPRYWDGAPTVEPDGQAAYYEDDVSISAPGAGHNRLNLAIDFRSKLHVDHDIPHAVTIDAAATTHRADGALGIYRGVIDEDQCLVLEEKPWNARMTTRVDAHGTVTFASG